MNKLRKRLLYQSTYRGSKEMDILLARFAEDKLDSLSEEELLEYEALLQEEDVDLYKWFTGQEKPPINNKIMQKLLEYFHVQ
jgi:antitoxin CptB